MCFERALEQVNIAVLPEHSCLLVYPAESFARSHFPSFSFDLLLFPFNLQLAHNLCHPHFSILFRVNSSTSIIYSLDLSFL